MDKSTGSKPDPRRRSPSGKGCTKERFCNTPAFGRAFKGLGVAKRYCRRDSISDSFVQYRPTAVASNKTPPITEWGRSGRVYKLSA